MNLLKRIVCNHCSGEFEIESDDDYPVMFCPSCGTELEEIDEDDDEDSDDS